ncbi:MAG: PAAR domain-containing protein [Myxococcota bacterium]
MPDLSTKVDLCRGHDACPPRAFQSFSPNVFAEGFEVTREGDAFHPHGCPVHPPHGAVVRRGYPSVFVNRRRVAYIGATVTCPSGEVATGRPSVRLGDG